MTVEVVIDEAEFAEALNQKFDEVKIPVQDGMADRMYEIVDGNLGENGQFRPSRWKLLGEDNPPSEYAKKVGRAYATLRETGRMGTTIDLIRGNYDAAVVRCDDEVAMAHQFGLGNMKNYPRPFFPIRDGEVTDEAREECVEAGREVLQEIFK